VGPLGVTDAERVIPCCEEFWLEAVCVDIVEMTGQFFVQTQKYTTRVVLVV
jgi:hypothetical protein